MTTPLTLESIRQAPKALLHDHLDGGLRPATVLELGPTARGARQTSKRDVEYRFKLSVVVGSEAPRIVEHVETMPALKTPLTGVRATGIPRLTAARSSPDARSIRSTLPPGVGWMI